MIGAGVDLGQEAARMACPYRLLQFALRARQLPMTSTFTQYNRTSVVPGR